MAESAEQKTEQEHKDVPYEVHKEIVDLLDAHNRRLTYTIVFLIVVIFMIVATGIWFLNQYEYTTETVTVDSSDGVANYLGGDGSITNGNPWKDFGKDKSSQAEDYQEKEWKASKGNACKEENQEIASEQEETVIHVLML